MANDNIVVILAIGNQGVVISVAAIKPSVSLEYKVKISVFRSHIFT